MLCCRQMVVFIQGIHLLPNRIFGITHWGIQTLLFWLYCQVYHNKEKWGEIIIEFLLSGVCLLNDKWTPFIFLMASISVLPFSSSGCLYFLAHHAAVRNWQGVQRSQSLQHVEGTLKNIRFDLHRYACQGTFCHNLPEIIYQTQCAFVYWELLSLVLIRTHFRRKHNFLDKSKYPITAMCVLLS